MPPLFVDQKVSCLCFFSAADLAGLFPEQTVKKSLSPPLWPISLLAVSDLFFGIVFKDEATLKSVGNAHALFFGLPINGNPSCL